MKLRLKYALAFCSLLILAKALCISRPVDCESTYRRVDQMMNHGYNLMMNLYSEKAANERKEEDISGADYVMSVSLALERAQNAWVQYRDLEAVLESGTPETNPQQYFCTLESLTRERASHFAIVLNDMSGGYRPYSSAIDLPDLATSAIDQWRKYDDGLIPEILAK